MKQFKLGTVIALFAAAAPSVASAAAEFRTELQGGSPYVQRGTTELYANGANYAIATPNTLRIATNSVAMGPNPASFAGAWVTDRYTILGPEAGEQVAVSIRFDIDYEIRTLDQYYLARMGSSVTTPLSGRTARTYDVGNSYSHGFEEEGTPDLSIELGEIWTVGQTYEIEFYLGATSFRTDIDAGHTATIHFDLPDGYTLTSELGWTPVPEPASLALLAAGALAMAGRPRRSP